MYHRFEVISIDLFGPLIQGVGGYRYIVIVEDCASWWVELLLFSKAMGRACAEASLKKVLLRYGTCHRIISDNGSQFIAGVMQ